MRCKHIVLLLLVALGEYGCREPDATEHTTRSVTAVANTPRWARGAEWRIDKKPVSVITPGRALLSDVRSVLPLPDRSVVVIDAGGTRVRRLSANTALPFLTSGVARTGPLIGSRLGDTLALWDIGSGRAIMFDTGGRELRRGPAMPRLGSASRLIALLPRRRLCVIGGFSVNGLSASGPVSLRRDVASVIIAGEDGRVLDTIARVPTSQRVMMLASGSLHAYQLPLGPRVLAAAGGGRIYVGSTARYAITAYDSNGRPLFAFALPRDTAPIALAAWEQAQRTLTNAVNDTQARATVRQMLESVPRPNLPQIRDLLVDSDGNAWIAEQAVPSSPSPETWAVVSSDGTFLGKVEAPPKTHILAITTSAVFAVSTEDISAQRLYVFALRKP